MNTEAGRELDALVAEKVMGWRYASSPVGGPKFWQNPEKGFSSGYLKPLTYSTDIGAAWEVVEKLHKSGENGFELWCDGGIHWQAKYFIPTVEYPIGGVYDMKAVFAEADTAPLAICLAALKAVGYEGEE